MRIPGLVAIAVLCSTLGCAKAATHDELAAHLTKKGMTVARDPNAMPGGVAGDLEALSTLSKGMEVRFLTIDDLNVMATRLSDEKTAKAMAEFTSKKPARELPLPSWQKHPLSMDMQVKNFIFHVSAKTPTFDSTGATDAASREAAWAKQGEAAHEAMTAGVAKLRAAMADL